jgi:hypothetical protein
MPRIHHKNPAKAKAKALEKRLQVVKNATNRCYEIAKDKAQKNEEKALPSLIDRHIILLLKSKIDDIYLEEIKLLDTSILDDIIFFHKQKTVVRRDRTVETIMYEIARRSLMNDRSDTNND